MYRNCDSNVEYSYKRALLSLGENVNEKLAGSFILTVFHCRSNFYFYDSCRNSCALIG